jgi:DNA-directed RNA polymerase subunit RPC12/RpoP
MTHWEFSHLPFDGELTDNKIVCQNCGWSWNVKDGGDDLYVCHKCNTDNSKFYLDKEVFSNAVDPNLIIQVKKIQNKPFNYNMKKIMISLM